MRRGGVEPLAVDDQVPVVAELDALAAQGHQAFDVELVLRQAVDAFGFEHDDFAALGRAEVVGQPVNEEMVAGADPEFDDVLALVEDLVGLQPGARFQDPAGGAP